LRDENPPDRYTQRKVESATNLQNGRFSVNQSKRRTLRCTYELQFRSQMKIPDGNVEESAGEHSKGDAKQEERGEEADVGTYRAYQVYEG
jgi:hypothetical protein